MTSFLLGKISCYILFSYCGEFDTLSIAGEKGKFQVTEITLKRRSSIEKWSKTAFSNWHIEGKKTPYITMKYPNNCRKNVKFLVFWGTVYVMVRVLEKI